MTKYKKLIEKLQIGKMTRYEIIIYWSDEDTAFIAEVPELSGCMADGASYDEVMENIQQAMKEWIETAKELDRPIPEPKGRLKYA
jgi:predicted RNase H-like HicB family nuclease